MRKAPSTIHRVLVGILAAGLAAGVAAAECPAPFHVLVVNDDGVKAAGIAALVAELATDPGYRITVVAPAEAQSGMGHAHIYTRTIEVTQHKPLAPDCPTWAVDATPATTVAIALTGLLAEDPPDLVLSGINKGENFGQIAWYSGTVGAAREAALRDLPAIAFSLQRDWEDPEHVLDYAAAARWAKPVVDAARDSGLPAGLYLNVNLPKTGVQTKGYRIVRAGTAKDRVNRYEMVCEGNGARFFKSSWKPPASDQPGTDVDGLLDGWVVIVPMTLEQTEYSQLPLLYGLSLTAPASNETPATTAGGAD